MTARAHDFEQLGCPNSSAHNRNRRSILQRTSEIDSNRRCGHDHGVVVDVPIGDSSDDGVGRQQTDGSFDAVLRSSLPAQKQYFTDALAISAARDLAVPLSAAAGLVDPRTLADCTDTATRMTAAAVESWLAGAYAAGYRIPDLDHELAAGHAGQRVRQ